MTTLTQQELANDGQITSITRVAEDAARKAVRDYFVANPTTKENAQRGHAAGDELAATIRATVQSWLAGTVVSDKYKSEEVVSNYGYLSGYSRNRDQTIELIVADVERQAKVLDGLFNCGKKFDSDFIVRTHPLCPSWVEKFFATFDWRKIASTYPGAVQIVLDMLNSERKGTFHNYRSGEIDTDHLRESVKKATAMQVLQETQKSDLRLLPAQFGIRHRGRSVRRARDVFVPNEFGLGAQESGSMLLTHPERLQKYDDLWIDCAGDEFKPSGEHEFSRAPVFCFHGGKLRFDAYEVAHADDDYGSASGFLPQ